MVTPPTYSHNYVTVAPKPAIYFGPPAPTGNMDNIINYKLRACDI